MMDGQLSPAGDVLTVFVPLAIHLHGGRKLVLAPDGEPAFAPVPGGADNALIKAVARAHHWQTLLESGAYATITELAEAEKINASYVSRILRLTLLAPDIVEAILAGSQHRTLQLARLLRPFPVDWDEQRRWF